jgi:hypothetical protein
MEISKFSAELMGHLNTSEWKTCFELVKEVGSQWKKEGRRKIVKAFIWFIWPDLGDLVQEPSSGTLYTSLHELESYGVIESRWRDVSPEVLARTGGHRLREYRLTE